MATLAQMLARTGSAPRSPHLPTAADAPPRVQVDLLTVTEAAELLRVSDGTIRNWITAGSVPYIQLPPVGKRKQYRIPLHGLLSSLEGNYDLRGALAEQNALMVEADLTED
jgi:excisionase family DNA binding protein